MSERLSGRKALLAGASRGIGRTIAGAFSAEGASVFLLGRSQERLDQVRDALAETGDVAGVLATEISDSDRATKAVELAAAELEGLDIVVNCASIHNQWARVGELPIDSWDETIAINLSGTFYICRAALPIMAAAGRGSIVNITSVGAERAWQLVAPFCAAKAGVELLTQTIALEYASDGIRANCVAPGVIDAGITDDVLASDPGGRKALEGMHPLARLGRAEEVAEAVVWLASDASSFTTGTTLAVDGGFLA